MKKKKKKSGLAQLRGQGGPHWADGWEAAKAPVLRDGGQVLLSYSRGPLACCELLGLCHFGGLIRKGWPALAGSGLDWLKGGPLWSWGSLEPYPEPVAPRDSRFCLRGEEHWLLDTSLDEVYWPCRHSRAIASFPSQLEWKIGLAWANTRGSLNSPS